MSNVVPVPKKILEQYSPVIASKFPTEGQKTKIPYSHAEQVLSKPERDNFVRISKQHVASERAGTKLFETVAVPVAPAALVSVPLVAIGSGPTAAALLGVSLLGVGVAETAGLVGRAAQSRAERGITMATLRKWAPKVADRFSEDGDVFITTAHANAVLDPARIGTGADYQKFCDVMRAKKHRAGDNAARASLVIVGAALLGAAVAVGAAVSGPAVAVCCAATATVATLTGAMVSWSGAIKNFGAQKKAAAALKKELAPAPEVANSDTPEPPRAEASPGPRLQMSVE